MSPTPTITQILAVTGSAPAPNSTTLSIGVAVDGKPPFWGACTLPQQFTPPRMAPAEMVETLVAPALLGQPAANLFPLCQSLESLTETVLYEEPVAQGGSGRAISRRAFFTGQLAAEPAVEVRQLAQQLPLPPELRYAVSIALLAAASAAKGVTAAELVASEFSLTLPSTAPALHQELDWGLPVPDHGPGIGSYGLTPPPGSVKKSVGGSGERLQGLVRGAAQRIAASGQQPSPTIHLSLNGTLGALFDGDTGKMLGALYGLERAAGECRLRVEDALLLDDRQAGLAKLVELAEMVRFRKMRLQLGSAAGIDSLDALAGVLESKAIGAVRLRMASLGSFPQTVQAALNCREEGIEFILDSGGYCGEFEAQLAALLQPAALMAADLHRCRLQMDQLLGWLGSKTAPG